MDQYDISPKALKRPGLNLSLEVFERLELNKCFIFNFADVKESYLRNRASLVGKQLGRKFKVIKHKENQLFEVARIA